MKPKHNLIITGTGRAGTTFLVRLLTALGQPTGYDADNWQADYFPHCAAGLERKLTDPNAPYIVKDPDLCTTLGDILAAGTVVIDHAIVPLRELEAAALSRIRIGGSNGTVPGGLVGTDDPKSQKAVLAERFHRLVTTLAAHDVPHTFLLFPRFVTDAEYLYAKLKPIFPSLERARFLEAFRAIADGALVHTFAATDRSPPTRTPTSDWYLAHEQTKRRWRRLRRTGGWSAAVAAIVLTLGVRWPGSSAMSRGVSLSAPPAPTLGATRLGPRRGTGRALSPRLWLAPTKLSEIGTSPSRTFVSPSLRASTFSHVLPPNDAQLPRPVHLTP